MSEKGEEMTFGFPGPRCSPWSGFGMALASCTCSKGQTLHIVPCVTVCLLHPAAEDKLCLCTSLLLDWGRSELWEWMCSSCSASFCGGSVPRGQVLAWAQFPGLGPFIPVPLVSKEFPPAISECWDAHLGIHLHMLDRSCQDLPALDAVSRLQQLVPEICFREALLS